MKNCSYTKLFFLLLGLFTSCSLRAGDFKDLFKGKVEPYVTYESNYSKLINRQVQFSGYGLGFDWESGLSLGLNFYKLGSNVITPRFSDAGAEWQLETSYLSFMAAWRFLEKEKFLVIGELGNGFGRINFQEASVQKTKYGLYTFEPTLHSRYYVLPWLGLAAQLGYRLAIPGGPPKIRDFSSFKFDIGFTIAPIPFYNAIKNNTLFN